jgi:outer membrane protein assembly factor BamA
VPVTEGDQYRLRSLTIQNVPPDRALSIPVATLRDQFQLRNGDLFNVTEIKAGLERLTRSYGARGYAEVKAQPEVNVDNAAHRVDLILHVTEGVRTP